MKKTVSSVIGSLPERIKPRDLGRLNEGLAYLFQELRKATELHQSNTNAGREGAIHSVETTIKFLSLFAPVISLRLHAPLGVLCDALMSLDDGKALPLLKPAKKLGRMRASALRGSLIGGAVFTVKRLTETGMKAPAAHQAVASALKRVGIKPARGRAEKSITARTIRGWCEEVSVDVGRHGEAAQTYDLLIKEGVALPKQALLDRLTETAKVIRAQEGA
jgi:hypothetical protein